MQHTDTQHINYIFSTRPAPPSPAQNSKEPPFVIGYGSRRYQSNRGNFSSTYRIGVPGTDFRAGFDIDVTNTFYPFAKKEPAGGGGAGGTDLAGLGWVITGAGLTAGEVKMFNKESWFSVKQWKTYGQNFNGNGYTGGKIASAKTISNTFKWAGRGLGAYSAYSTNQQYQNGEISFQRMTLDQASNAYSTFGGIYGAAWGVGWEIGRAITQMGWYQQWKQDVWYPWREEHLGY